MQLSVLSVIPVLEILTEGSPVIICALRKGCSNLRSLLLLKVSHLSLAGTMMELSDTETSGESSSDRPEHQQRSNNCNDF